MPFAELMDRVRRDAATSHAVIEEAWPPASAARAGDAAGLGIASGYFRVRVVEMALADDRRWQAVVAPAAFVCVEHGYDGQRVRRPLFLGTQAIAGKLPDGVEGKRVRVRFENLSVVGATPIDGGDVELFVGLFQATLEDRLRLGFDLVEKVLGAVGSAPLAAGVKLVDQLSGDIVHALNGDGMKCLLAHDAVLNPDAPLRTRCLSFVRSPSGAVDCTGLRLVDGQLRRVATGGSAAVDDLDYCTVSVECFAMRGDVLSLPHNRLLAQAREVQLAGRRQEAAFLLQQCIREIAASPDLTEDHKLALIRHYQVSLPLAWDAAASDRSDRSEADPHRGGNRASLTHRKEDRALELADPRQQAFLKQQFEAMAKLENTLAGAGASAAAPTEAELHRLLRAAPNGPAAPHSAAILANALCAVAMEI